MARLFIEKKNNTHTHTLAEGKKERTEGEQKFSTNLPFRLDTQPNP